MFKITLFGILIAVGVGYFICPRSTAHLLQSNLLKDIILVQARVINIKEDTGILTGTLKIMHVYCGPDKLLGETFSAYSSASGQDTTGRMIYPPLQLDEEGIWSLKIADDKLVYVVSPQHGISWPARGSENTYANAIALAKVIEQVCKAESAEQMGLLQSYATDRIPEISVWAIHVMSMADPEDRVRLFTSLISNIDSLSIPGQAALDEVLSNIDNDPWRSSEKRLALMNKWVSKAMSKDDAALVIQRLDIAAQHSELEDKTILKLLQIAISNQGIPPAARQNGIQTVGLIAKRAKDGGLAFEYLVRIIEESGEEEFKITAAYTIKNFVSIDRDKRAIIQSLKAKTTNRTLAEALEEGLKHPKNQ